MAQVIGSQYELLPRSLANLRDRLDTSLNSAMTDNLAKRHVYAWYSYAWAAEVFSACALAIFLPITLEQMARDVGRLAPDYTLPCSAATPGDLEAVCKARMLGRWVDSASFSMYVKSIAVAAQALSIISIGPLADSPFWRKRLLVVFAYTGSVSAIAFFFFSSSTTSAVLVVAALLTIIGNAGYAISIVCANAFLPDLAKEDPHVVAARGSSVEVEAGDALEREEDEAQTLLPRPLLPAMTAITSISTADLANEGQPTRANQYSHLLSLTTSRISSTGIALGLVSSVGVLALLMIPVSAAGGTSGSLRAAIGSTGVWWAAFTIPAWIGLPSASSNASRSQADRSLVAAWKRVGRMIRPAEIRRLPNLFTFLLAWIFLSDGFHTTTYTAVLYASSSLKLGPTKVIIIGLLVQLAAVGSTIMTPRYQRKSGLTNRQVLLWTVVLALLIPIYACVGLMLPFGGLRTEWEMYVAATWFGIVYGPFNSYARAVFAELIPPGHESTFFSLFSLTDKSASFFGPLIVGIIADHTGNIRLGFVFLLAMLSMPVPVLLAVDMEAGKDDALAWLQARDKRARSSSDV